MCKNILIIEDDAAIRQTMADILEIHGYQVFLASDGREGAEQLNTIAPGPCVILLDMMMPGTNGWQFLDVQRNDPKFQNIPVVICSAYEESAKSVKPNGFIPKPIQLDQLLGAVKDFCA